MNIENEDDTHLIMHVKSIDVCRVERSPRDTMQADHLLKVFNWYAFNLSIIGWSQLGLILPSRQVAGAICATVLGASLQGARIRQRRDEVGFHGRVAMILIELTQLELSIKRRLEEESRNLDLPSAQVS